MYLQHPITSLATSVSHSQQLQHVGTWHHVAHDPAMARSRPTVQRGRSCWAAFQFQSVGPGDWAVKNMV